jgi:hypothetical protein
MQCEGCIHGKRNQGFVIPTATIRFFCSKVAGVKDEAAAELFEPLLRSLATKDQCPHFDGGSTAIDAYRAEDLDADDRPSLSVALKR